MLEPSVVSQEQTKTSGYQAVTTQVADLYTDLV